MVSIADRTRDAEHALRSRPSRGWAPRRPWARVRPLALAGAIGLTGLALAGCQVSELSTAAHLAPLPPGLEAKMDRLDMAAGSPILLRIFKEESVLEVWKEDRSGRFRLLKEYDICAWSGELGPKLKEGDRQAPEGFYTVTRGQMNPNSSYHLAFNLGFPNTFDRSLGRTGSHLMVHGDCSSRGCYAMEDGQIQEIYALAREAFAGGQRAFQVQAFPFRMTAQNMARHNDSEHRPFWEMLKAGSDHFEVTNRPPRIDVCDRRYVFNATPDTGAFEATATCPSYTVEQEIERLVAAKQESDRETRDIVIAQMQKRQEREQRWEERESAIAAFLSGGSAAGGTDAGAAAPAAAGEGAVAADTAVTAVTSVAASTGTPVPRPAPRAGAADGQGSAWFPNPFARSRSPVASVSGVPAADDAAIGGAPETPPPAITAPAASPAVAAAQEPQADDAAGAAVPSVLGYAAEEEDGGFFSSITEGGKGLFRRAGKLFN